eukprot:TRINITY_DN2024_c0_g2_i1.p1 TRINITY_DN2024_c0_g2~~TRINITY_DN2024_c0_g2_i1.p1  ORF type:complete len:726 (-),score=216.41 TRINITY_DN2024_c0_g2_i1:117-2294(-)
MRLTTSILVVSGAAALTQNSEVTPTEKVIKLLTDLKDEVTAEGTKEKETYDKFAKFCTDTDESKNEAIKTGKTSIQDLQATIVEKEGELDTTNAEVATEKQKKETLSTEKKDNNKRCTKAELAWGKQEADLTAAVNGLTKAVAKLKAGKETADASFLQTEHVNSISNSLQIADALGLIQESDHRAVTAFLQGDPWLKEKGAEYNKKDYKFQSNGIVSTLEELLEQFTKEKDDATKAWEKTDKDCQDLDKAKADAIKTAEDAIKSGISDSDDLVALIAKTKETLRTTKITLKDDQEYLAILTKDCADRKADNDQRVANREAEIEAIETAVGVLNDKVKAADEKSAHKKAELIVESSKVVQVPSFLQQNLIQKAKVLNKNQAQRRQLQRDLELKDEIADRLEQAGRSLDSERISFLALQLKQSADPDLSQGNPLIAVRQMIGNLLSALRDEATKEATQKGSCDARLNKANFEKAHRYSQMNTLNKEIRGLEVKRVTTLEEISVLTDEIKKLTDDLADATKLREDESKENVAVIKEAKDGKVAVKEAMEALDAFYNKAQKAADRHDKKMAKSFIQVEDEQTPPASTSGSYAGKQGAAVGILGMMEVIMGDFAKCIEKTTKDEAKATAEFREFKSASKQDIGAKTATKDLADGTLKSVVANMGQRKVDIKRAVSLLDDSLKVLEGLKAECVDNQPSYAERKAKRDNELKQLKAALCLLDPNDVEELCKE